MRTNHAARRDGLLVVAMFGLLLTRGVSAATFDVGSFNKVNGLAPAPQVVPHNLGETPKALILWTMGAVDETFSRSYRFAIGASDGTSSESSGASSEDNPNPNASRRVAYKALTIVQWNEALLAEADLVSWDAAQFTLNWTTNDNRRYVIHYMAIGGDEVQAKVRDWVMQSGSTGNQSVAGFGFQPELVIHFHIGAGFTTAPPAMTTHAIHGLGVMDASGNQWHTTFFTWHNASPRSDTQRYQRTTSTLAGIRADLTLAKEASFVSMDPDGFTIDWTTMDSAASRVYSLALAGLLVRVGSFDKSIVTPTALQSVTGVGFTPRLVLLQSFQSSANTAVIGNSYYGIGASNLARQASSAIEDTNDLSPSSVHSIDKASKVFIKVDDQNQVIQAEANLASMDTDGFTLDWTTNDAAATQMLYVALSPRRRQWLLQ